MIDETVRSRFVDLVQQHAQELLEESDIDSRASGFEGDLAMVQRRVVRGACYRAFRQLWSEHKDGTLASAASSNSAISP
ncbi:MAG: hypothetical protein ABEK03_09320 [Candidatus Bipolaricaulia bacterium]